MYFIKMNDLNLAGKRVLIRSDLNVPLKNGKVSSDLRIKASLPTIEAAIKQNAKVILASHLGNPIEGKYDSEFSLKPIVNYLKDRIPLSISLSKDYLNGLEIHDKELVILENVRFNKGEKENDETLAKKYAALCDVFIMDAFGVAHRIQASTNNIIKFAPLVCAGLLFSSEIETLNKVLKNPARPMIAIIGGSKISTKLTLLKSLSNIVDQLIVGGGIANTFIAAQGYNIGKSLYENNLISEAKCLLREVNIPIPTDVRVATNISKTSLGKLKYIDDIKDNEYILDLGDSSIFQLAKIIKKAKTILWNGPLGMFEFINFRKGTEKIANAIAESDAFSIVGGGDTIAAIDLFNIRDQISYISTGGGAFLKFVEDKKLPTILMMEKYTKR